MTLQGGSLVLVGFAGWEVLTFKSVEPALYTLGIELKDFFFWLLGLSRSPGFGLFAASSLCITML